MTNNSGRGLNKRALLLGIAGILLLAVGGAAAYYFYTKNQQQQAEQKNAVADERNKLDEAAFRGDRDIAAQYIEMVQRKEFDKAYNLYESAAKKLTDSTAKVALYEQAVSVASRAKQMDHAAKYAATLSAVSDSHRASANAAYLYGQNKDYENQKKYLQQAIAQLETLPKDSQEYTSMKAYYEGLLSKVGTN